MARKKISPSDSSGLSKNKNKPVQKLYNKSDIPDNVLINRNETLNKCMDIERRLPYFFADYFLYLKNAIAINSRLAYLSDLQFFCQYLIDYHPNFEACDNLRDIDELEFYKLSAKDINLFLGDYCTRYVVETENADYIVENNTRALARKRSSLSVLFKFLYRNNLLETNITEGFNPIKMPKPQPDAIKRLEIEEVAEMLKAVETGSNLTPKERQYWEKTKLRDKAILILFTTYGLRVSELQQLNISSFNYTRGEFRIFRKRGKETTMPINHTVLKVLQDYIQLERGDHHESDDPLFISLQGTRMTVRAIRDLVKKYTSIAMQVPRDKGYSPHKLRATAASSLIQYGFSIYDVQNLLDHENVTTTQLYSAHKKNAKRDVINQYELLDEFNQEKDRDKTK